MMTSEWTGQKRQDEAPRYDARGRGRIEKSHIFLIQERWQKGKGHGGGGAG